MANLFTAGVHVRLQHVRLHVTGVSGLWCTCSPWHGHVCCTFVNQRAIARQCYKLGKFAICAAGPCYDYLFSFLCIVAQSLGHWIRVLWSTCSRVGGPALVGQVTSDYLYLSILPSHYCKWLCILGWFLIVLCCVWAFELWLRHWWFWEEVVSFLAVQGGNAFVVRFGLDWPTIVVGNLMVSVYLIWQHVVERVT